MAAWDILLITGPAGAGKTTVARASAAVQTRPTVPLSLDDFRGPVVSGFANPLDGWDAECARQYTLARAACAATARLYIDAGFGAVIDDAIFPDWPEADLEGWLLTLRGLDTRLVVLLPSLDVSLARAGSARGVPSQSDAQRASHTVGPPMVRTIYAMMLPWRQRGLPLLDNSRLSAPAAAARIAQLLNRAGRIDEANFI